MIQARRVQRSLRTRTISLRSRLRRVLLLWLIGSGDLCAGLSGGRPPEYRAGEDDHVDFFQNNQLKLEGTINQDLLFREFSQDRQQFEQERLFAEDVHYVETLARDRAFFDNLWILRGIEDEVENSVLRFPSRTSSPALIVNQMYQHWHGIWDADWKLTRIDADYSSYFTHSDLIFLFSNSDDIEPELQLIERILVSEETVRSGFIVRRISHPTFLWRLIYDSNLYFGEPSYLTSFEVILRGQEQLLEGEDNFLSESGLIQAVRFDSFQDRLLDTSEPLVFPVALNGNFLFPLTQEKVFGKQLKDGFIAVCYRPAGRISRRLRSFHTLFNLYGLLRSHWEDLKEEKWILRPAHHTASQALAHKDKDGVFIVVQEDLLKPSAREARILAEIQEHSEGTFYHRVDAFQWSTQFETTRLLRHHQVEQDCLSPAFQCQIRHNDVEIPLISILLVQNGDFISLRVRPSEAIEVCLVDANFDEDMNSSSEISSLIQWRPGEGAVSFLYLPPPGNTKKVSFNPFVKVYHDSETSPTCVRDFAVENQFAASFFSGWNEEMEGNQFGESFAKNRFVPIANSADDAPQTFPFHMPDMDLEPAPEPGPCHIMHEEEVFAVIAGGDERNENPNLVNLIMFAMLDDRIVLPRRDQSGYISNLLSLQSLMQQAWLEFAPRQLVAHLVYPQPDRLRGQGWVFVIEIKFEGAPFFDFQSIALTETTRWSNNKPTTTHYQAALLRSPGCTADWVKTVNLEDDCKRFWDHQCIVLNQGTPVTPDQRETILQGALVSFLIDEIPEKPEPDQVFGVQGDFWQQMQHLFSGTAVRQGTTIVTHGYYEHFLGTRDFTTFRSDALNAEKLASTLFSLWKEMDLLPMNVMIAKPSPQRFREDGTLEIHLIVAFQDYSHGNLVLLHDRDQERFHVLLCARRETPADLSARAEWGFPNLPITLCGNSAIGFHAHVHLVPGTHLTFTQSAPTRTPQDLTEDVEDSSLIQQHFGLLALQDLLGEEVQPPKAPEGSWEQGINCHDAFHMQSLLDHHRILPTFTVPDECDIKEESLDWLHLNWYQGKATDLFFYTDGSFAKSEGSYAVAFFAFDGIE